MIYLSLLVFVNVHVTPWNSPSCWPNGWGFRSSHISLCQCVMGFQYFEIAEWFHNVILSSSPSDFTPSSRILLENLMLLYLVRHSPVEPEGVYNSLPLVWIMRQINPVFALPFYFFKDHFNIIFSSLPRSTIMNLVVFPKRFKFIPCIFNEIRILEFCESWSWWTCAVWPRVMLITTIYHFQQH